MYSNNRCNGVSKRNSKKVVEQGADYCLALKNNHKIMYQEVESFFQQKIAQNNRLFRISRGGHKI